MFSLNCTLLGDGPSDRLLLEPLKWLLQQSGAPGVEIEFHADTDLGRRVKYGLELYPADLYLVHRDAEKEPVKQRLKEIQEAWPKGRERMIPVIPVRMSEAWLLIDEAAIRMAAGRPGGRTPLELPKLHQLEKLPDPKTRLEQLLRLASESTGRRWRRFDFDAARLRVAELITDYSPLLKLTAYKRLENDVKSALKKIIEGASG